MSTRGLVGAAVAATIIVGANALAVMQTAKALDAVTNVMLMVGLALSTQLAALSSSVRNIERAMGSPTKPEAPPVIRREPEELVPRTSTPRRPETDSIRLPR